MMFKAGALPVLLLCIIDVLSSDQCPEYAVRSCAPTLVQIRPFFQNQTQFNFLIDIPADSLLGFELLLSPIIRPTSATDHVETIRLTHAGTSYLVSVPVNTSSTASTAAVYPLSNPVPLHKASVLSATVAPTESSPFDMRVSKLFVGNSKELCKPETCVEEYRSLTVSGFDKQCLFDQEYRVLYGPCLDGATDVVQALPVLPDDSPWNLQYGLLNTSINDSIETPTPVCNGVVADVGALSCVCGLEVIEFNKTTTSLNVDSSSCSSKCRFGTSYTTMFGIYVENQPALASLNVSKFIFNVSFITKSGVRNQYALVLNVLLITSNYTLFNIVPLTMSSFQQVDATLTLSTPVDLTMVSKYVKAIIFNLCDTCVIRFMSPNGGGSLFDSPTCFSENSLILNSRVIAGSNKSASSYIHCLDSKLFEIPMILSGDFAYSFAKVQLTSSETCYSSTCSDFKEGNFKFMTKNRTVFGFGTFPCSENDIKVTLELFVLLNAMSGTLTSIQMSVTIIPSLDCPHSSPGFFMNSGSFEIIPADSVKAKDNVTVISVPREPSDSLHTFLGLVHNPYYNTTLQVDSVYSINYWLTEWDDNNLSQASVVRNSSNVLPFGPPVVGYIGFFLGAVNSNRRSSIRVSISPNSGNQKELQFISVQPVKPFCTFESVLRAVGARCPDWLWIELYYRICSGDVLVNPTSQFTHIRMSSSVMTSDICLTVPMIFYKTTNYSFTQLASTCDPSSNSYTVTESYCLQPLPFELFSISSVPGGCVQLRSTPEFKEYSSRASQSSWILWKYSSHGVTQYLDTSTNSSVFVNIVPVCSAQPADQTCYCASMPIKSGSYVSVNVDSFDNCSLGESLYVFAVQAVCKQLPTTVLIGSVLNISINLSYADTSGSLVNQSLSLEVPGPWVQYDQALVYLTLLPHPEVNSLSWTINDGGMLNQLAISLYFAIVGVDRACFATTAKPNLDPASDVGPSCSRVNYHRDLLSASAPPLIKDAVVSESMNMLDSLVGRLDLTAYDNYVVKLTLTKTLYCNVSGSVCRKIDVAGFTITPKQTAIEVFELSVDRSYNSVFQLEYFAYAEYSSPSSLMPYLWTYGKLTSDVSSECPRSIPLYYLNTYYVMNLMEPTTIKPNGDTTVSTYMYLPDDRSPCGILGVVIKYVEEPSNNEWTVQFTMMEKTRYSNQLQVLSNIRLSTTDLLVEPTQSFGYLISTLDSCSSANITLEASSEIANVFLLQNPDKSDFCRRNRAMRDLASSGACYQRTWATLYYRQCDGGYTALLGPLRSLQAYSSEVVGFSPPMYIPNSFYTQISYSGLVDSVQSCSDCASGSPSNCILLEPPYFFTAAYYREYGLMISYSNSSDILNLPSSCYDISVNVFESFLATLNEHQQESSSTLSRVIVRTLPDCASQDRTYQTISCYCASTRLTSTRPPTCSGASRILAVMVTRGPMLASQLLSSGLPYITLKYLFGGERWDSFNISASSNLLSYNNSLLLLQLGSNDDNIKARQVILDDLWSPFLTSVMLYVHTECFIHAAYSYRSSLDLSAHLCYPVEMSDMFSRQLFGERSADRNSPTSSSFQRERNSTNLGLVRFPDTSNGITGFGLSLNYSTQPAGLYNWTVESTNLKLTTLQRYLSIDWTVPSPIPPPGVMRIAYLYTANSEDPAPVWYTAESEVILFNQCPSLLSEFITSEGAGVVSDTYTMDSTGKLTMENKITDQFDNCQGQLLILNITQPRDVSVRVTQNGKDSYFVVPSVRLEVSQGGYLALAGTVWTCFPYIMFIRMTPNTAFTLRSLPLKTVDGFCSICMQHSETSCGSESWANCSRTFCQGVIVTAIPKSYTGQIATSSLECGVIPIAGVKVSIVRQDGDVIHNYSVSEQRFNFQRITLYPDPLNQGHYYCLVLISGIQSYVRDLKDPILVQYSDVFTTTIFLKTAYLESLQSSTQDDLTEVYGQLIFITNRTIVWVQVFNSSSIYNYFIYPVSTSEMKILCQGSTSTVQGISLVLPKSCCLPLQQDCIKLTADSVNTSMEIFCTCSMYSVSCVANFSTGPSWIVMTTPVCTNPAGIIDALERNNTVSDEITNNMIEVLTRTDILKVKDVFNIIFNRTNFYQEEIINLFNVTDSIFKTSNNRSSSAIELGSVMFEILEQTAVRSPEKAVYQGSTITIATERLNSSFSRITGVLLPNSSVDIIPNSSASGNYNEVQSIEVVVPQNLPLDQSSTFLVIFYNTPPYFMLGDSIGNATINNSKVIAATLLNGVTPITTGINVSISFRTKYSWEKVCAWWNVSKGSWSDSNCFLQSSSENVSICNCNHLTHFGLLLNPYGKDSPSNAFSKTLISVIGCSISAISLVVLIIISVMLKKTFKTINLGILLSLSASLLSVYTLFLIGMVVDHYQKAVGCAVVAGLLHYFLLATMFWMGSEGVSLFISIAFAMRFYPTHLLLKMNTVSWGVPAVFVAFCAGFRPQDYKNQTGCVVIGRAFLYGLLLPVCAVLAFNLVVLIAVMRRVLKSKKSIKCNPMTAVKKVRLLLVSMTLLGLSWVFGALAVGDVRDVFQYLFIIFSSLQGFFLLVFQGLIRREFRSYFLTRLSISRPSGSSSL